MEAGISACLFAPFLAGIVSIATMRLLLRNRSLPLDEPNERSLHVVPVPRTGGLAIAAGVLADVGVDRPAAQRFTDKPYVEIGITDADLENLPDFSARYLKIAPDSQSVTVAPPGPS